MRKLIPLSLISFFLTSFVAPESHYFLLDSSDFEYMVQDNEEPALTIPDKNFESFNKWQCFDTRQAEIVLTEVNYNGWQKVPGIIIEKMEFDIDPDINWDAEKVKANWTDLVQGSKSLCIFGAFLQDNDETSSWYIQKIKTDNGYWNRDEYQEFLIQEDD